MSCPATLPPLACPICMECAICEKCDDCPIIQCSECETCEEVVPLPKKVEKDPHCPISQCPRQEEHQEVMLEKPWSEREESKDKIRSDVEPWKGPSSFVPSKSRSS